MTSTSTVTTALDSLCSEEVFPTVLINSTDKLMGRPVTVRQITLDACSAFAAHGLEIISAELKGSALVDALFHRIKPTCAINSAPADIDVVISVVVKGTSLGEINERISHITTIVASLVKSYFPPDLQASMAGLSADKFLLYANQYRFIYPSSMTPCIYRIGLDERPLELGVWAYWNAKNISQREGIFNCERLFVDLLREERSLAVSYASYFSDTESLSFWRKKLEELETSEGISSSELSDFMTHIDRLGGSCTADDLAYVRKKAIKFIEMAEVPLVLEEIKKGLLYCPAPSPMRGAFARFFVKISQGYYDPTSQTLEAISYQSKEGVVKQNVREELFNFVAQKKYPPPYRLALYLNILLTKTTHPDIGTLQRELYALCTSLLALEGLEGFLSPETLSIEPLIRPLILRAQGVECRLHRGELCLRLEIYFSEQRYFLLVPSSFITASQNTLEQERVLLSHKEYRAPYKQSVDSETLKLYSSFFGPDASIYHYLMVQKERGRIDARHIVPLLEKILKNEEFFISNGEMALRDVRRCLQSLSPVKLPSPMQQACLLRLSSLKPEILEHISSLKIAHLFEIVSSKEEKIEDASAFNQLKQALQTLSRYLFPLMFERTRVREIISALDRNWGIFLADELERIWLQEPSLAFLIRLKHHKEFFTRPVVQAAIRQKAPFECDAFLSLADTLSTESMSMVLEGLGEMLSAHKASSTLFCEIVEALKKAPACLPFEVLYHAGWQKIFNFLILKGVSLEISGRNTLVIDEKYFFSDRASSERIITVFGLSMADRCRLADYALMHDMQDFLPLLLPEKQLPLEELTSPVLPAASSLATKLCELTSADFDKGKLFFAVHYADSRYFPLLRGHIVNMPPEDMLKKMYLIAVMYWRLLSAEKAQEINALLDVADEKWENLGFHATKWLIDYYFSPVFLLWKKKIACITSADIEHGVDLQYFHFLTTFVPFKPAFQEEGFARLIKLFDATKSPALFHKIAHFFTTRRLPLTHASKLINSMVGFAENEANKIEPEEFINSYLKSLQPFLEFQNDYVTWESREKFLHALLKLKIFSAKTNVKAAEYIAGMFSHVILMHNSSPAKETLLTSLPKLIEAFLLIDKKNTLSRVVILSSLQSFIIRSDLSSRMLPHLVSLWEPLLTEEVLENHKMRALAISSCSHLFKHFCECTSVEASHTKLMLLVPLIMKRGTITYIDYLQIGCAISYFYRAHTVFDKSDVAIVLSWMNKFPLDFVITQTKETLQTPFLISVFFEIREIIVSKKIDFSTKGAEEEMAYFRICQERLYRFMLLLVKEYDNAKLEAILRLFRTSQDDPGLMRKHLDGLASV